VVTYTTRVVSEPSGDQAELARASPKPANSPTPPAGTIGAHTCRAMDTSGDHHDPEGLSKLERRRQRSVVAIPRLRAIGNLFLVLAVGAHNLVLLPSFDAGPLLGFAALTLAYTVVTKLLLVRWWRPEARVDLGTVFLATDVILFVLALYVSGGERSWLLPVLCVRVADQIATSRRRAFAFASWAALLHTALVLYLALGEARELSLAAEMAKVVFIYVMNGYLALAAGPHERQRAEAVRATAMAHELIAELGERTRQLEVQRARAEAASRAKGTFLANISHEIRTPMNAVMGMTELLLEEPLLEPQRKMADTILSSGRSLLAIVNDVLDMAKVEAGELNLHTTEMDLARMVESVLSPMRVLAEAKDLSLRAVVELPWPAVRADEMRLRQVLFNLVGNAIKFTPRGQVTIRVSQVAESADSVRVRFSVEDTGIGMTEQAAARVFDAFQQADESTTRRFGGTGLGLSISKQLVAMMGGALTLRTAVGCGSTFEFELALPRAASVAAQPVAQPSSSLQERVRARSPSVLIAEDTEVNRVLLQRWLEWFGCKVSCVEDGAQALAVLTQQHGFDLVFMDWHMPALDGLEATARVRQWEAEHGQRPTRIIGFTASAFSDEVARCKKAGMDDVLVKPLVRTQLDQMLALHVLESSPARVSVVEAAPAEEPRLDAAVLAELQQLGPQVAHDLLARFVAGIPARLTELSDALASDDRARLRGAAHGLRGAAGCYGAKRLIGLTTKLELQAEAQPEGDLAPSVAAVAVELEQVAKALRAVLAARFAA
jgi:signal transduction histidine kinase/CheY-like chemotaxis protein